MVESFIVSKLDTIAALAGQIYPTAATVGDCDPPFAIYTAVDSTSTKDLSGEVAYYTDTIRVHFLGNDYDILCALIKAAEGVLSVQCEEFDDIYVFSSGVRTEPDGFDMNLDMHRKTIFVTIQYWR